MSSSIRIAVRILGSAGACLFFAFAGIVAQTPAPTPDAERTKTDPEYRKKWEEYEKRRAEVIARNKQITETNARIEALFLEGNAAYRTGDYERAITKYDAAIALDDYWGTLAPLLNNKAITLRMIGVAKYNEAVRSKSDPAKAARSYFAEATAALLRSLKILSGTPEPDDPGQKGLIRVLKLKAIKELYESSRLLAIANKCEVPNAFDAFDEFALKEPDAELKEAAKQQAKELDQALSACRRNSSVKRATSP